MTTLSGWITIDDRGDSEDILFVSDNMDDDVEPFAEMLEFMHWKNVTVRYWIANEKCSIEQASEDFIETLMGRAEVKYGAQYSEITGYLWTDEDLKVGGHDLIEELKGNVGKYLIFQVDVN